jgi:maltose alpha-D-glucosyltransferase/alpha-amylase
MMKKLLIALAIAIVLVVGYLFTRLRREPARPDNSVAFTSLLKQQREKGRQDATHPERDVWYKNSLIYTLDIKMFKDSDGDGTGDIKGLISKLDYIRSLGTDIIWLPPFFPSPLQDDGYDISDYYKVDPRLGSMEDFKALITEAGKRGMRIMIDLVLNHTSVQHPWFQQSRQAGSGYRDWYVWSVNQPKNQNKGMVFLGYQDGTWSYDPVARANYYHRFYNYEPDLNTQNPVIKQEMDKIMRFWLATGIAGFRVDAVTYLTEKATPDKKDADFEHDYTILKRIRDLSDSVQPANIVLGEASVKAGQTGDFFGRYGESLNMVFNFYADQWIFYALATEDTRDLQKILESSRDIPLQSSWVYFLRNQDEMGMGKLNKAEKEKVYKVFAPEKNMQLYDRGVRRRLAPMMKNNQQWLKMAYSFLFSLQGVPMIRYGDEIGMGDDLNLNERMAVRTPMQWSDSINAGFSSSTKTLRPVISQDTSFNYRMVNVARSEKDSVSLLNWIKTLVALRKKYPGIVYGNQQYIKTGNDHVLAVRYDWNDTTIVIVHNFSKGPQQVNCTLENAGQYLQHLLSPGEKIARAISGNADYQISLEPYGYKWYEVVH